MRIGWVVAVTGEIARVSRRSHLYNASSMANAAQSDQVSHRLSIERFWTRIFLAA
jgi:hypothetical protein